jgi:multiple sugar transport system substrate-binding protein
MTGARSTAAARVARLGRLLVAGLATAACVVTTGCGPTKAANGVQATGPVEIDLMRFFGSCESEYGSSTDPSKAAGECGILTSLVNEFNAQNQGRIVVRTQVAEWAPYYDQLNARLVAGDVPTIAVMHESMLGDYVRRKLVEPLDAGFAQVGIDTGDFTDHARRGVVMDGHVWALPFDTWSWLWHFNMGLMRQAGLVTADGRPMLPHSPEELIAQARQFRQATGKPYFAWAAANEPSANARTFLTLLYQQDATLFSADGRSIDAHTPEVKRALDLMQALYDGGAVKQGQDYPGANQSFLNGEVGVLVVGTWTIGQFLAESRKPESALHAGYDVTPFPQLYARPAEFADGHSWVLVKGGSDDPRRRAAALALMKFLWDHDGDWARTGHLPTRKSVAASPAFQALPFRRDLAQITSTGVSIQSNVGTQRSVENLVGEEVGDMVVSHKPREKGLHDVEKRVNAQLRRNHH